MCHNYFQNSFVNVLLESNAAYATYKLVIFFFNVIKYDTSHLWQLIRSGLLKFKKKKDFGTTFLTSFNILCHTMYSKWF